MTKRDHFRISSRFITLILVALMMLVKPAISQARLAVGVVITIAPEPLPVYVQPLCPGPGFIWTPGFWAWGPDGYFWVPGTWVLAPFPGALWTPGYWAWDDDDGTYVWNEGYWGPVVGFYGGIFYGFGYTGYGYQGGYWRNGAFFYNQSVNNVSTTNITNVYNKTVVNNVTVNNVSYNGGNGGTTARPSAAELAAAHGRHQPPTPEQRKHVEVARTDPTQLASRNHGRPPIAATPKPGAMRDPGVVRASGAGTPASKPAGEPQPAGKWRPFSPKNPNPSGTERQVTPSNPVTPERGRPANKPEMPARTEPTPLTGPATRGQERATPRPEMPARTEPSPSTGPATRGQERATPKPGKPAKEKPEKREKHEPPQEQGRSHVAVNRSEPRMSIPARRETQPLVSSRQKPTTPARTSPRAAAPESQSRTARPQPNTAHTAAKDQAERHPHGGGR